jgi:pimeloyl-ACP methyl ester carboxylesterase
LERAIVHNEIIHFAPANGFTAGTYEKLLGLLRTDYTVTAIEKFGHNPNYPVNDNWTNLANELIDHIQQHTNEPIIGVGHSLGGVSTFIAAYNKPSLFKQVIMLEPPLIEGVAALLFLATKKLRILDRSKLVTQTRKRRTQWSSMNEAENYFRGKSLFKRFDPDCLRDYVQYGTTTNENGVRLTFDINVESDIYRTAPHNIGSYKRVTGIPGTVIIGKYTYIHFRYILSRCAKRQGFDFKQLLFGGHHFPLEHPEQTATLIREAIHKLNG